MIKTGRSKWLLAITLGVVVSASVVLAGCGDDDDDDSSGGDETPAAEATTGTGSDTDYSALSGDIDVDGSSTVGPITEAVAEEFGKVSDVRVAVGISGTGGGFEKFCNGETDINDASRPIKQEETDACAAKGIEFTEFKVAIDGLTVVVNPSNEFATCLTYAQLKQLWDQGSTVSNWNELDATFPDQEIELFGPGPDSGTFDYFTEEVNGTVDQSRADYTPSEDDNVLVQGVETDENALAYFGFAYYQEAGDRLKALSIEKNQNGKGTPVAESGGCVAPTAATINDNSYPLSRPLFIYVANTALAEPHVKGFVQYYLESAPTLVTDVGYVPLPDADYESGLAALEAS